MTDSPLLLVAAIAMAVMLLALAARLRALAADEEPKGGIGVRIVGIVAAVVGLAAMLLAWFTTR